MTDQYDVIVVGAGSAGIPATIHLAERGARVLVVEQSDDIGGTLHLSSGQMSAAGTKLQRAKGIEDHPDSHFDDVMRISRGRADPEMVRLAVDMAAETVDWLTDLGAEFDPASPAVFYGHEPYSAPRTHWGVDGARSYLKVLRPLFDRAVASGNVTLRLQTEMTGLVTDHAGAVTGVEMRTRGGGTETAQGQNVLLTTGGYGANARLFARLTGGRPLHSMCMPTSQGTGIEAAERVGAVIHGTDCFLPSFGGVDMASNPGRIDLEASVNLTPQERAPWEIYVNQRGERFVREDHPSVDARENALSEQPEMTFYIVYDGRVRRESPPLQRLWSGEQIEASFDGGHPSFIKAGSVRELAERCGIEPGALQSTIEDYNRAAIEGGDRLGREHLPVPLAEPPFYAVRCHGSVVRTFAGIRVDTRHRVLDKDGRPIPNLYAAGEIIGAATMSGQSFAGGMSITPAFGFGRRLGREILQWRDGARTAAAE